MAKLPSGFSLQALPIEAALSEGRNEDAKTLLVEILLTGKADGVVQCLAADMLKPPKRKRGRQKSLPRHWWEIGEQYHWMREDGVKYEETLYQLSEKFGYSETHIRKAVAEFDAVKAGQDESTRE